MMSLPFYLATHIGAAATIISVSVFPLRYAWWFVSAYTLLGTTATVLYVNYPWALH